MATARVVYEKGLHKQMEKLMHSGKRNIVQKARAAIAEAAMSGEIKGLERTHHGESRIPKAEKYDLGDGYRLVVQLVDGKESVRAFLFVGKHDDAQRWLDSHEGYRWVKNDKDGSLAFTQVSVSPPASLPPVIPDAAIPLSQLEEPLLKDLSAEQWQMLKLSPACQEIAASITRSQWESSDADLLQTMIDASDEPTGSMLLDLLTHAHRNEHPALRHRILMNFGAAHVASEEEAAAAMLDSGNSETFITWDNTQMPPADASWEEWMLFLQPQQREFARRDFNGPARLRGVSGSGKTCVVVHRARYLALKYKAPILVLTLTHSMRMLLERLLRALCGAEQAHIRTSTINALAVDVIQQCHPRSISWFTQAPERIRDIQRMVADQITRDPRFERSSMARMQPKEFQVWFLDEVNYVRGRLSPDHFDEYLDTKVFKRIGRSVPLGEADRALMLDAVRSWTSELARLHLLDYPGIASAANQILFDNPGKAAPYRCVLVDEVQDLSQVELQMVGRIPTPQGKPVSSDVNGLFLVGDGAQAIYKRSFSFSAIGIGIANRSFALKQNYRNTKQILDAAYQLIEGYSFADVDEESVRSPLRPEFASRNGDRPYLVKCARVASSTEADFITREVKAHLESGVDASQICIIGCASPVRDSVVRAFDKLRMPIVELRDDDNATADKVRISTIESSKGHEFRVVFVCGITEGVIPNLKMQEPEDVTRDASRLYVAMTRARDYLYLTYTSSSNERPSRFLTAVQEKCDEFTFDGRELRPLS